MRYAELRCESYGVAEKIVLLMQMAKLTRTSENQSATLPEQVPASLALDLAPQHVGTHRQRHKVSPFADRLARDACFAVCGAVWVRW